MLRASAVVLFSAGVLLTAGCSGSSTTADPGSSASASSSTSSGSDASSSPSSAAKAVDVTVSVTDGKVTPKTHRVDVPQGSTVRLMVTTDVDDEIHVHGYDLMKDVDAGETGVLEFVADQSGVFEVELEDAGLQLVQLQVQ